MKNITRTVVSALATVSLVVLPAVGATAAPTQTATITQAWGYQYSTLVNPSGTIQAVIDNYNGAVYIVDLMTNTATQVTDSGATFDDPYRGAFSPDGSTLYVSNYGADSVAIVDVSTANVTGAVLTNNDENMGIGVSPDGTKLVLNDDYGNIAVYDIANSYNQIGTVQSVSNEVIGVYFPDNSTALLVDEYGYLQNVNLTDGTTSAAYGDGTANSYGVCATSDLSTFYMPNYSGGSVEAIDAATGAVTSIDVTSVISSTSFALCSVSKDNKKVFFTDWNNDDLKALVGVVDATTKTASGTIEITGLAADDPTNPSYPVGLTDGINVFSDCKFIVDGYYGNAAIVDFCEPTLPNTGVDTVTMGVAAAGGLTLVALGALAVVLVRRRATR